MILWRCIDVCIMASALDGQQEFSTVTCAAAVEELLYCRRITCVVAVETLANDVFSFFQIQKYPSSDDELLKY